MYYLWLVAPWESSIHKQAHVHTYDGNRSRQIMSQNAYGTLLCKACPMRRFQDPMQGSLIADKHMHGIADCRQAHLSPSPTSDPPGDQLICHQLVEADN